MGNCKSNQANSISDDQSMISTDSSYSLRENMTREQKDVDIRECYDVIEIVGAGTMGTVARARKRTTTSSNRRGPVAGRYRGELSKKNSKKKKQQQQQQRSRRKLGKSAGQSAKTKNNNNNNKKNNGGGGVDGGKQENFRDFGLDVGGLGLTEIDTTGGKIFKANSSKNTNSTTTASTDSDKSSISPNNNSNNNNNNNGTSSSNNNNNKNNKNDSSVEYAIKSIHLNRVKNDPKTIEELRSEIDILKSMDHPNIVKPIETFEHRSELFIVMELCSGGDLTSRGPYTESEAARLVYKIVSAVAYMHRFNVMHRDLKMENIMFADETPNSELKVIDFGLSMKYLPDNPHMFDSVGTIYTMAPQVLQGVYTVQADMWSIGVLAFMMLGNEMPFYGNTSYDVIRRIMKCRYDFESEQWSSISDEAKDFVSSLLKLDPQERPTAKDALNHPWFEKEYSVAKRRPADEFMNKVEASLGTYAKYKKLKKLALLFIAHKSTTKEIGRLKCAFEQYDSKKDGTISFQEFEKAFKQCGYSRDELEKLFNSVDLDRSGYIFYSEFLAATIETTGVIEEEKIAEAFDRLDTDGSGFITKKSLRTILGTNATEEYINAIMRELGGDDELRVSYEEFLELWNENVHVEMGTLSQTLTKDVAKIAEAIDEHIPGGWDDEMNNNEEKKKKKSKPRSLQETQGITFERPHFPVIGAH